MDAERVARLLVAGKVTPDQVARAASLGLVPMESVPEEARAAVAVEAEIRATIEGGLAAIRDANARLDAVISAAGPIEAYDPGTKTAVQVLADVVPAVRQLATGVRLLAQGEKLALTDIDYLARLQLRLFDGA